jgi:hypothetical protein
MDNKRQGVDIYRALVEQLKRLFFEERLCGDDDDDDKFIDIFFEVVGGKNFSFKVNPPVPARKFPVLFGLDRIVKKDNELSADVIRPDEVVIEILVPHDLDFDICGGYYIVVEHRFKNVADSESLRAHIDIPEEPVHLLRFAEEFLYVRYVWPRLMRVSDDSYRMSYLEDFIKEV